jgi:hypothetical protein
MPSGVANAASSAEASTGGALLVAAWAAATAAIETPAANRNFERIAAMWMSPFRIARLR